MNFSAVEVFLIIVVAIIFTLWVKQYTVSKKKARPDPVIKQRDASRETRMLLETIKRNGILATFRENGSSEDREKIFQWALGAVGEFGAVIENAPSQIQDVKLLPYPKEDLKIAFMLSAMAVLAANDSAQLAVLKNGYHYLGSFQEIIPTDRDSLKLFESSQSTAGHFQGRNPEDLSEREKEELCGSLSKFTSAVLVYQKYLHQVIEESANRDYEFEVYLQEMRKRLK
jgi:hypothetical protein